MSRSDRAAPRRAIATAGLLVVALAGCARPAPPLGEPTPIPTSEWTGGSSMAALLEGTLARDPGGCLVVGQIVVLWPKGFTAVDTGAGAVSVLDAGGALVARTGETLKVGGGELPTTTGTGPCLEGREVFEVNDELPVLEPSN